VGAALIIAGAGSMVLAGLVLLVSSRRLWRAALVQLGPPAVGLIVLALAG
jgi:putative membrane protein